ncbi:MAG: hypothetical protein GX144_11835 [Clostridiaceae bacterium]|nr:hypothetical protein [Clostridiaceae bacterium]
MTNTPYEIGSEYTLNQYPNTVPKVNLQHLLKDYNKVYYCSGRSAIRSVLLQINGTRALLPSYICQSVIDAFERENCSIDFYDITPDLSLDIESIVHKYTPTTDVFFFINYFGRLQNKAVLERIQDFCKAHNLTIIEDTTHSLPAKVKTIGDYCVASLRKWFGLPDGGVSYSINPLTQWTQRNVNKAFTNVRTAGLLLKDLHLRGLGDYRDLYRELFSHAEKILDHAQELHSISEFSEQQIIYFDIAKAAYKRKENSGFLHKNIHSSFVKPVFYDIGDDCLFFYPIYVKNRDIFRKHLEQNGIYCPVHWPIADKRVLAFDTVKNISQSILSIPVDQRYDQRHMEYICNIINDYKGGCFL